MVVHGEAFGCGEEHDLIPPMLEGAKQNLEAIGQDEDYFKGELLPQIVIIIVQRI